MSRPASSLQPFSCDGCGVNRAHSICPLPRDVRAALDTVKTTTRHEKGDTVFSEGEPCHSVFIVCEGSVKLVTASSEGKVLLLRVCEPGEMLGIAEAVRDGAYECSAIAGEHSTVAAIKRETFLRFVGSYLQACVKLTEALSEQYKAAQRETRLLAFENTRGRIARLLLDWSAQRGEVSDHGIRIPNRLTHTELAQAIGTTRETVTRVLGDLTDSGIIERTPDALIIRNEQVLTTLLA